MQSYSVRPFWRFLQLIDPFCNRKSKWYYFYFSIRGNSLEWLFAQSHTLSVLGLGFITSTTSLLSTHHTASLCMGKGPSASWRTQVSYCARKYHLLILWRQHTVRLFPSTLLANVCHSERIWVCGLYGLRGLWASGSWTGEAAGPKASMQLTLVPSTPALTFLSRLFFFLHLPDLTQGISSSLDFICPSATC